MGPSGGGGGVVVMVVVVVVGFLPIIIPQSSIAFFLAWLGVLAITLINIEKFLTITFVSNESLPGARSKWRKYVNKSLRNIGRKKNSFRKLFF